MARPLRVNIADGWYHCMNRGIERRDIFVDEQDYRRFLSLLGEAVERYRFRVHTYCLMPNHFHLIIQTPDANLSVGMQWLGLAYSAYFNARYDRVGPLFQGRFKSVVVEEGQWARELSLYVHLNPVRTLSFGLSKRERKAESLGYVSPSPEVVGVRLKALRSYPWSSYRSYAGYHGGEPWLCSQVLLRRGRGTLKDARCRYRSDAQQLLKVGVDPTRLEMFRDVVAIGSAEFVERVKALAGEPDRETERGGRLRERVSPEQVLSAVEQLRGEPRDAWFDKRGDWGKWLVLALARRYCGLSLKALGASFGGRDYAAVSVGLKRFEERLRKDSRLRTMHKQAKDVLNV